MRRHAPPQWMLSSRRRALDDATMSAHRALDNLNQMHAATWLAHLSRAMLSKKLPYLRAKMRRAAHSLRTPVSVRPSRPDTGGGHRGPRPAPRLSPLVTVPRGARIAAPRVPSPVRPPSHAPQISCRGCPGGRSCGCRVGELFAHLVAQADEAAAVEPPRGGGVRDAAHHQARRWSDRPK